MDTTKRPTNGTEVLIREMIDPESNNRRPGKILRSRIFPAGQEQYAADWGMNHDLQYWVDINHF